MADIRRASLIAFILLAVMQLAACSRTVQWDEEVPLNTGETIWVKRSGSYSFGSQSGNPLKFGYNPDWRSTIEFTYKGKRYSHTDAAGFVLLAIAPDGRPNLVASAAQFDWHLKNHYYCVVPYYVQFRPDETGKRWTWPDQVDPWLYGLPTNLIFGLIPVEASGKKFTPPDRAEKNASLTSNGAHYRHIEPTFSHQRCLRRD